MKPLEDVVRRLARDWLAKAATDLAVCDRLLTEGTEFSEAVAFHAQQAAEKSLKALLVARQVEFPKTHDIDVSSNLSPLTTGRWRTPWSMPRSLRLTVLSIGIPESTRRYRRRPPMLVCR